MDKDESLTLAVTTRRVKFASIDKKLMQALNLVSLDEGLSSQALVQDVAFDTGFLSTPFRVASTPFNVLRVLHRVFRIHKDL